MSIYYRQAITVKILPATNFRGTRYKASCARGSTTLPADQELNPEGNAEKALRALLVKFIMEDFKRSPEDKPSNNPWRGPWHGGQIEDGRYVFVKADLTNRTRIDTIGNKYVEEIS